MRSPFQAFLIAFVLTLAVGTVAKQPDDLALPLALTLAVGWTIRRHRDRLERIRVWQRLTDVCHGDRL